MSQLQKTKHVLRLTFEYAYLIFGVLMAELTKTPIERSHRALLALHGSMGVAINEQFSRILSILSSKKKSSRLWVEAGKIFEKDEMPKALKKLKVSGCCVLDRTLEEKACERLKSFALNTPSAPRPMTNISQTALPLAKQIYKGYNPTAAIYDFNKEDLIQQPDIQNLISDDGVLELVRRYLGCSPYLNAVSMWWQTDFLDRPDAEAAQFFHFDMDGIKWVKIFIYLTDVSSSNGPHTYVLKSHQINNIPQAILKLGYARLEDREIHAHYPRHQIYEITGKQGTIIIEDTRGLHKAKNVQSGNRLILQLQYSNSLFGMLGNNYRSVKVPEKLTDSLATCLSTNKKLFRHFFE